MHGAVTYLKLFILRHFIITTFYRAYIHVHLISYQASEAESYFSLSPERENYCFTIFFHIYIQAHIHVQSLRERCQSRQDALDGHFSLWRHGTLLKGTLAVLWKQHLSCYQSAITHMFIQSLVNMATYLISGVNITLAI